MLALAPDTVSPPENVLAPVKVCTPGNTAISPDRSGTDKTRVVPVVIPASSNCACLVASPLSCNTNAASENAPTADPIRSTDTPACRTRNLAVVRLYQTSPLTGAAGSPATGLIPNPFITRTRPEVRSITSPWKNVVPSADTLTLKSSPLTVPISARPENPV